MAQPACRTPWDVCCSCAQECSCRNPHGHPTHSRSPGTGGFTNTMCKRNLLCSHCLQPLGCTAAPPALFSPQGQSQGEQSHETSPKSASVQGCVPIGALKKQKHGAELMPHSLTGSPVLLQPNCVINETQTSLHQNPRSLLRAAALMAPLPVQQECLQEGKLIFAKVTVLIIVPFL